MTAEEEDLRSCRTVAFVFNLDCFRVMGDFPDGLPPIAVCGQRVVHCKWSISEKVILLRLSLYLSGGASLMQWPLDISPKSLIFDKHYLSEKVTCSA